MEDGKVIARGVVAKMRDASGDTVKGLLNGGPSDADASEQSPQVKFRAPSGISPQAIQNAGKRKLITSLPASWDGGTKKAAGQASGDPGGQAQVVAPDSGNGGGKAPGRKS